jgi:bidirectional [NiFe] hydrogenase diaphorase subunit
MSDEHSDNGKPVTFTINGREVQAAAGSTVLEAARAHGIEIPTLCYHPAVAPRAACRVCLVEQMRGKRSRLVASCAFPVSEGIVINTDSEAVLRTRRVVVELLLARSPDAPRIRELAASLGITESRFSRDHHDRCILCGLCVDVCQQLVGKSAIGFTRRGIERRVETPYGDQSDACIGCDACVAVCPTGAINVHLGREAKVMETWHTELPMRPCRVCGRPFAPDRHLAYLQTKTTQLPVDLIETCEACRRASAAGASLAGTTHRRAGGD